MNGAIARLWLPIRWTVARTLAGWNAQTGQAARRQFRDAGTGKELETLAQESTFVGQKDRAVWWGLTRFTVHMECNWLCCVLRMTFLSTETK